MPLPLAHRIVTALDGMVRSGTLGAETQRSRRALVQSPTEHGRGTELWTLNRVDMLIEWPEVARAPRVNSWA